MSIAVGSGDISNIYLGSDALSAVYLGSEKVRPTSSSCYEVNSNTVLYYPLNSTYTYTDQSLSPHTSSNSGTSFGTYAGVDCAYFNRGSKIEISSVAIDNVFTFSWRQNCLAFGECNTFSDVTINQFISTFKFGITSGGLCGEITHNYPDNSHNISCTSGGYTGYGDNITPSTGVRYYCAVTRELISSCNYYVRRYVNGQEVYREEGGGQRDLNVRQGNKYLGRDCYYTAQSSSRYLYGYLSNFICENGARTASEVAAYYDCTKALYGVS